MMENENEPVVIVHLTCGGYVRGAEAFDSVVDEMFMPSAKFLQLTDPGSAVAKVVPVDRVAYIEEEA